MNNNAIVIGWNRLQPGREKQGLEHFQEFLGWLGKQQQAGVITGFTPVQMQPHGGDLNGFILVTGEPGNLQKLTSEEQFTDHVIRGTANMLGLGTIPAFTGQEMQKRTQKLSKFI